MDHKKTYILPESEKEFLCFDVGHRVTVEEYQAVIKPGYQKVLDKNGEIKLLLNFSVNFLGWDIEAASEDFDYMTSHGKALKKAALVNAPDPVVKRWTTMRPILGGDVKLFNNFDEALAWLKA